MFFCSESRCSFSLFLNTSTDCASLIFFGRSFQILTPEQEMDIEFANNKTKKLEKKLRDINKAKIFKHKGNERNYLFDLDLAEKIEESISLFKENDTKTASKNLRNCLQIIRKCNKLIRLAGKSEAGWAIVQEYQTDELASDTDDDRKIRRPKKKMPLRRRNSVSSSRRDHSHSLLVMILELVVFFLLLSKACQTLYQQLNVTIFVATREDHNLTQYEKGVATPVLYLVTGGTSVSRSKTSDYWKVATLTQHSSRVHDKNPSSSNNKKNLKKIGPLKVENMKDKYVYVSGKSIDSEEEFLVNFDQDAVQGINFDKNVSEYEQGE